METKRAFVWKKPSALKRAQQLKKPRENKRV
jgi:hypothetical protein